MFNYDPNTVGKEAKDLFDKLYADISFDKKLYKELHKFRLSWINKAGFYSEFLGGNTIGVHPIRFSSRDDQLLMSGIYNTDPSDLLANIRKLPDINSSWAVSTNPVLQTLCYTMHRFIIDGKMGNKLDDALEECYLLFSYKVFGSLLSRYFPRPASVAVAKAANEKLANRYLIKRLGSWDKVLTHRAQAVTPPHGTHVDRLRTYTTDDAVRVINDMQGAIRSTVKYMYKAMLDVSLSKDMIATTSLIQSGMESDDSTRDVTDRPDKYVIRLKNHMGSTVAIVDENLMYLVSQLVPSSDIKIIKDTLITLSESYNLKDIESIYIEHIVVKTIAYCNTRGLSNEYRKNILDVVSHMKGYWSSGSVTDKDVKFVKKIISRAVKRSTKRKTKWVISANSLAVIIYLMLRAIK